jgi:hypothetical protein
VEDSYLHDRLLCHLRQYQGKQFIDNQRFKTETFSLIDSLYPADSFTLMQPYQVVADPNTTFAAPTDTISDQTGILATDVTAPVTVLPDTTEVTQPTDTFTPTTTDKGVTPPIHSSIYE